MENSSALATKSFSLSGFAALSLSPRSVTRNFPLLVEGYDVTGPVQYVQGVDLSTGAEKRRVRVFLRDIRLEGGGGVRPAIRHYATDPYLTVTDADFNDRRKMEYIRLSLEARCFTAPGGVLMVQSAFDDAATGAISAYWVNRIVGGDDLVDKRAAVVSPVLARMSRPVFPRGSESGKTYCACDILHPEKILFARSMSEFDNYLFNVLSVSPTTVPGKSLAVIRLVDATTGEVSTQLLERRAEKVGNGLYVAESPVATVARLWSSMSSAFAAGLRGAIEAGVVEAVIVPGTRYRLIGRTLELLESPANKRIHLPWERFGLSNGGRENGFLRATVALLRHKGNAGQPVGDEDFFITGVWPVINDATPVVLQSLDF